MCGVDARDGWIRDPSDLFHCPQCSLKDLAVEGIAIPKPGSNTAAQDALYRGSIEGGRDDGWKTSFPRPALLPHLLPVPLFLYQS